MKKIAILALVLFTIGTAFADRPIGEDGPPNYEQCYSRCASECSELSDPTWAADCFDICMNDCMNIGGC